MSLTIQEKVSLAPFTTLGVGGTAAHFVEVVTREELREAIDWAKAQGMVWRIIGGGSNIFFPDGMTEGLTIRNRIGGISASVEKGGVTLLCGAGEELDDVVAYACEQGWWGLENLSAIPGTVGATPVQNVGAYGVEVADLIVSVSVYDAVDNREILMQPSDCRFSYRHSLFKEEDGKRYVITGVTFFLPKERGPVLAYRDLALHFRDVDVATLHPGVVREAVVAIRAKKFPNWRELGTAGSFFKNPTISKSDYERLCGVYPHLPGHETKDEKVKVSLGWVLDHACALRGYREGNLGTFPAQALVVVNYGGATADEVCAFSEKIAACVKEKTGISIEQEVTYIH